MIVIALGGNLASAVGPPQATIASALAQLDREGIRPVAVSPMYATEAWPDPREPTYVNAVARLRTGLSPEALIDRLLVIEREFGRERGRRNAPRTLDIDLLDYNGIVCEGVLVLPHARMHARRFVLAPLADVAPDWRHPVLGKSVHELLATLPERERSLTRLRAAST